MKKAKPFDISKRAVWEAYLRVKANQGAAGVDEQSIQGFEADRKNNLYKLSAHHDLATLNEVIAGSKVSWVLEADLKNFFGSLDHVDLLRFVELRVGDPRLLSVIRRWLKAGILEDGELRPNEQGTPQGGSMTP